MHSELHALPKNDTCLVPRTSDMNVMESKWVIQSKPQSDGSIERLKACLVAEGYSQISGLDFDETFTPLIKSITIQLILLLMFQTVGLYISFM